MLSLLKVGEFTYAFPPIELSKYDRKLNPKKNRKVDKYILLILDFKIFTIQFFNHYIKLKGVRGHRQKRIIADWKNDRRSLVSKKQIHDSSKTEYRT